jgi:CheY-like chemotaxis protein/HPt (histidine-containing phosphotransfer) domain-containing protein
LAISKQLVELMSGQIGVRSEEGRGAEFWFTARFDKQPPGAKMERLSLADLQNVRVLIVDDNATHREILTRRLISWGMRPTKCEDGPSALDMLRRGLGEKDLFRLAVIDMQMPGMNGETLGRIIMADPLLADTRMVMLTSMGMRGDTKRFAELGFVGYLTKPVRHEELRGVLSLALSDRGGALPMPERIATRYLVRETGKPFEGRNIRILLAEDNITNQQVAKGFLKKFGLQADAVANGREAVNALEAIPYDLVLMDVQMPVMDGLSATRQIRNPKFPSLNRGIPIVAMTAYAMQGDRERCLGAGMNDYLSKPIESLALLGVLQKWLPEDEVKGEGIMGDGEAEKTADAPVPRLPVWDRASMKARLMDDEELMWTVLDSFILDVPDQIEAIREYLKAKDVPGVERQAHTIKGASANVGGEVLRQVAFEMEKAARDGDLIVAGEYLPDLEEAFNHLQKEIKRKL